MANLKSIIDARAKYADYMIKEITHICKDMKKRAPGSEGEKEACEYMAGVMKDLGADRVSVESFKENPGSFYGWIYLTVSFVLVSIVSFIAGLYTDNKVLFVIPVILILAGLVLAVLQFGLYKKTVDWMFPEMTGTNVTAIKSCTGEVKRRIFFNGHPDAAWEWPVNYKLGGVGFESHAIIGFMGAFYYLILAIIKLAGAGDPDKIRTAAFVGFIFVPFLIGLYFMWNKKRVVDGANDNLSGCYMGIAILKALKDEGIDFENTEVGVILSGSEEAGLRGAKAWADAHCNDFNDVPTFIYSYDTIHDPKYLMANYRNLNGTVKTDKDLNDLFMESCAELGIPCIKGWVPPMGGATDDAAYAQKGMRAAGITGLNHKLESYYHTRKDSYDNMNAKGLADCFAASVKVLEKFDNGAKQ